MTKQVDRNSVFADLKCLKCFNVDHYEAQIISRQHKWTCGHTKLGHFLKAPASHRGYSSHRVLHNLHNSFLVVVNENVLVVVPANCKVQVSVELNHPVDELLSLIAYVK